MFFDWLKNQKFTEAQTMAEKEAMSYSSFFTYIKKYKDDIALITVACRKRTGRSLEYTVVQAQTPSESDVYVKNIYFSQMAGYRPVYDNKGHRSSFYGWIFHPQDFDIWNIWKTPANIMRNPIVNLEALFEVEKYKYCAYTIYSGDIVKYLRAYNEDSKVEYFGKLGLPYSKKLSTKIAKDKQFAKFLIDNADQVRVYGTNATIKAYKEHISPSEAAEVINRHNSLCRLLTTRIPELKETDINREKLSTYLDNNGIHYSSYNDYLNAIKFIGLSLDDTKNIYPKDFQRMHDLRINEKASLEVKRDAEKREALYKSFAEVMSHYGDISKKYGAIVVVLPTSPADLIREGDILSHCVGKMGYDKKIVDGKSIIAFIRSAEDPDKPFVTIEYGIKEKKILQCYGEHDSRPSEEIREIAEKYGKFLTKKLKEKAA